MNRWFSLSRWLGIVGKEFIQLKRDRLTFGMIVGIPVMQLMLFGFAINSDPKHLPTALLVADRSEFSRSILAGLQNSDYFDFVGEARDEADARPDARHRRGAVRGDAFRRIFRAGWCAANGRRCWSRPMRPIPTATGNAIAAVNQLAQTALAHDLTGPLAPLRRATPPRSRCVVHPRYNPEAVTQYNIVPGLMGVILTMTMVMMTGLAITRERERGTMENLLATPATALEVMTGKIVPYILIGLVQVTIILVLARLAVQRADARAASPCSILSVLLFIAANLTLGLTFSSLARNQLQAMQMTFFFFLPSILLSGFMFPFRGMPGWAQADRRSAAADALPAHRPRRAAQGQRLGGNLARGVADRAVHASSSWLSGCRTFRSTLD